MRAHLAVWLDAVLQAVELPAGVADLASGLADVDGDCLTHGGWFWFWFEKRENRDEDRSW